MVAAASTGSHRIIGETRRAQHARDAAPWQALARRPGSQGTQSAHPRSRGGPPAVGAAVAAAQGRISCEAP